ncbi:MAG: hypothetical protein V4456_20145 [Bacteroidota bacterium]
MIAKHFNNAQSIVDSADVTLIIRDKKSGKLYQKISFGANYINEDVYKDCTKCRSYITGYHQKSEVLDYDYGDLIIADLNFDGREDIAIKNDSGGNGGPYYNFYLQGVNGQFILSQYLTTNMQSFPAEINAGSKTLTIQIHANVHQDQRNTFKYNSDNKKWRFIKHRLISYGE